MIREFDGNFFELLQKRTQPLDPLRRSLFLCRKVILRCANLSTTQRYLGTASDVEAMRYINNLYGYQFEKGEDFYTSPLFGREIE